MSKDRILPIVFYGIKNIYKLSINEHIKSIYRQFREVFWLPSLPILGTRAYLVDFARICLF